MIDLDRSTDLCRLLGDSSRLRLMALLAEEELTVAELTQITTLPQSRVSTHLGKLREAGMVRDRRSGTSSYYRLNDERMPSDGRNLWAFVQSQTNDPVLDQDHERLARVLRARSVNGTWADSVAGQMDRHYSPGRTWEATASSLLGLVSLGDVIDIASGDGVLAELLAPRAQSVACVDESEKVVRAGQTRLKHFPQVRFHRADMHSLPFADRSFDQAILMNALPYTTNPEKVFRDTARVLRPGAALVGCALLRHRHREAIETYSHRSLGIDTERLRDLLEENGFEVDLCRVTSRERRKPHFEVITFHARRLA